MLEIIDFIGMGTERLKERVYIGKIKRREKWFGFSLAA